MPSPSPEGPDPLTLEERRQIAARATSIVFLRDRWSRGLVEDQQTILRYEYALQALESRRESPAASPADTNADDMTPEDEAELLAALTPVILADSFKKVRDELADLIADANAALATVSPSAHLQSDNALYYPLLFLTRALEQTAHSSSPAASPEAISPAANAIIERCNEWTSPPVRWVLHAHEGSRRRAQSRQRVAMGARSERVPARNGVRRHRLLLQVRREDRPVDQRILVPCCFPQSTRRG